jgi:hypothetical protein
LADGEPAARLVVVIDQFEEIFTLCDREELRRALISNLLHAARVASGQTLVIVTMRADFYGKCAVYSDLADALSDHHLLVGPMSEEEIRRAIERPAQLAGREFDAGLVGLLVQDARAQRGALPLLQHALLELWKKCAGRRLTVDAYRQIGGLVGALQKRTDSIFSDFSERERDLCRRIFLRLTQPGEGTELIRRWPQLRKWIDADRAGLRTRTRLTESGRDWKNSGRDPEPSRVSDRGCKKRRASGGV